MKKGDRHVPSKPITAWSYSRLSTYLKCPRQFRYAFIDKLEQQKAPAMERGQRIHDELQAYVERKRKRLSSELISSIGKLMSDVDGFRKSKASCELELAVNNKWEPVPWFDPTAWLRAKLDVFLEVTGFRALIADYKTGRENPVEHAEQLELYVPVVYSHYPHLHEIEARMLYVDHGTDAPALFVDLKDRVPKLRAKWEKKSAPVFKDKTWRATPGYACRYCAFSSRKGGPCDKG